ncbi:MAG: hypothetical protein GAK43_01584 [Stenotrophomonas maltophilia]|nr:MAG: hypothetical protein GAK43_01584 [Stenotrophomonas maltophilia]
MSTSELNADQLARWNQLCAAAGVDPARRLATRLALLADGQALDCTLYRPDEEDEDAEEEELGDARILLDGPFQPPAEWSEEDRDAYFDGSDPSLFVSARIECEATPGSAGFFQPEPGDLVALMVRADRVEMHYLYDCEETEQGCICVLLRDDQDF